MLRSILLGLLVAISLGSFVATAADDPSMHEIYEAANSGKLATAQEMIATVLRDHPDSAKAHYVAAELDARQNKFGPAREQLQTAERLAPGLPFAKPEALRALRSELGQSSSGSGSSGAAFAAAPRQQRSGISPGLLLLIVAIVGIVAWMIFRRRAAPQGPMVYPAGGNAYGGGYGAPGGGYPQAGPQGGGIGSGIAGGLASGLAVGAGVVAGEAIAHRLMGDGERERYVEQPPERNAPDSNANMGGEDFGVNDSSSWDDSSSADSGGGGDDWS